MSQETLELARAAMEALSQRDLSRLVALADPEVEWHSFFGSLGEGGVLGVALLGPSRLRGGSAG